MQINVLTQLYSLLPYEYHSGGGENGVIPRRRRLNGNVYIYLNISFIYKICLTYVNCNRAHTSLDLYVNIYIYIVYAGVCVFVS